MKYSFLFYTSATEIVYFSNSFYDEIITFGVSLTQTLLCNWRTQRSSPDCRGTRSHGLPFTIPMMDCSHPACVPLQWTNAQYCRARFTKLIAWYFLWYLSSNKLYEPFGMFVLLIGIYGALAQVLALYFFRFFLSSESWKLMLDSSEPNRLPCLLFGMNASPLQKAYLNLNLREVTGRSFSLQEYHQN